MKRQNAVIFSCCLILTCGLYAGVRIKEKIDKANIKKELNNVIIPNAERELKDFITQSRQLRDSIAYYENILGKIKINTDIVQYFPQLNEILHLTNCILSDWHTQYDAVQSAAAQYSDQDSIPSELAKKIHYMEEEIIPEHISNSKRLDFLLETACESIDNSMNYFLQQKNQMHAANITLHTNKILNSLREIKKVLNAINNSENIINVNTVKKLNADIDLAVLNVDSINKKLIPARKIRGYESKIDNFKTQKTDIDNKTKAQAYKVANLKHSGTVEKIYNDRKKVK